MDKILKVIESETSGKCYKSFKFCFDSLSIPTLDYEDSHRITVKHIGETDTSLKTFKSVERKAKDIKDSRPLFTYFLDGSRKTYKIDDIEYGKKIFPIIGGQLGVACCQRVDRNTFKKLDFNNSLVLVLPAYANADGDRSDLFFNNITEKLNKLPSLQKFGLHFSKILTYNSGEALKENESFENRGIAKIQDEMIEGEKRIVSNLVKENLLNAENYLIKDGSLQYKKMKSGDFRELSKIKNNYRCVVGVSKKFNPELSQDIQGKSNATQIAKLPLYHRTPAFMYQSEIVEDVKFSVWYLRVRDRKYTDSPFAGILKIEKMLVSDNEIEEGLQSDEIDVISANILNERNPTCYGNDARWANHLYPVYLTEKYIKSKYISDVHFLNLF